MIAGIILLVGVIAISITVSWIVLYGFKNVESGYVKDNLERVTNAISYNISGLDLTATDYANWDDSYDYMVNPNPHYVDSNFIDTTIASLQANMMLLIGLSGKIAVQKSYDLEKKTDVPLPTELLKYFKPDGDFMKRAVDGLAGIMLLPEGPLLFAARPVLTSKKEGPPRGIFMIGRFLRTSLVAEFSRLTNLSISWLPIDALSPDKDWTEAKDFLFDEEPFYIKILNRKNIAGFTMVDDISGEPAFLIQVELPRDIYAQGIRNVKFLVASLLLIAFLFVLLSIIMLEKQVISRISRLSRDTGDIGVSGDITKRVHINGNDELSMLAVEINDMLASLEKLQNEVMRMSNIKTEFTSMVSHELRTPLGSIKEAIGIVLDEIDGPVTADQKETLGIAKRNIDRLANLINNVLDFSKLEFGKTMMRLKEANLTDALDEVFKMMKPSAEKKNIVMSYVCPVDPLFAVCDGDKIKQVTVNLLNNAVKFSEEGGRIDLRLAREAENIVIEVEDTGIGIKEEDLNKIFEPFGQILRDGTWKTGGSGLGLAISRKLMQQHKGDISVRSVYGKGSRFTARFPADLSVTA